MKAIRDNLLLIVVSVITVFFGIMLVLMSMVYARYIRGCYTIPVKVVETTKNEVFVETIDGEIYSYEGRGNSVFLDEILYATFNGKNTETIYDDEIISVKRP